MSNSKYLKFSRMKHQSFLFSLLVLFSLGFFLTTTTSCKKKGTVSRSAEKMPTDLASHIYAYTSGVIPRKKAIKVRFVEPIVSETMVGQEVAKGVISFSPSIEGNAIWENQRTLVFQPTEWLQSGTQYLANLKVGKLIDGLPSNIQNFEFNFSTVEQYIDLNINGLETVSYDDLAKQKLTGKIYFGDVFDKQELSKILTASQNGQNLEVEFLNGDSDKEQLFLVSGIQRNTKASKLILNWNGAAIGYDKQDKIEIDVPSINDFKVTNIEVVNDPESHIVVYFSDPIKKQQNLKGLFDIEGFKGSLKTIVDGSKVLLYPSKELKGTKNITVSSGIQNIAAGKLPKKYSWGLEFIKEKPQVRLVGKGNIIPQTKGLVFPFEAISLKAVDVEVFKIYDNNILQFLQVNEFNETSDLERVGNVIFQQKFDLKKLNPQAKTSMMSRYAIDLQPLVDKDPYAIYQVRIGFKKSYADYDCEEEEEEDLTVYESETDEIETIWDQDYWQYSWRDRENPCKEGYYQSQNFVRRNVIASNIGLIAKRGNDGSIEVIATDLRTVEPLANVEVTFYDYAQQNLGVAFTDGEGVARLEKTKKPFVAIAKYQGQSGFLKLLDANALSLSRFDVAGVANQKGLKGYIYGERGVWRPGDSIYLNFVLQDKAATLPENHPVDFKLYDPQGQLQEDFVTSNNVRGVYPIHIATNSEASTGDWRAEVRLGGAKFTKKLKIETIKPNRLKVLLDFGKDELDGNDKNVIGDLQVNWLHGAPAQNLEAKVEARIENVKTKFPKYNDFIFDDPARRFSEESNTIFNGSLDAEGHAKVELSVDAKGKSPGKLKVKFKSRAFEKGGDFSTDVLTMPYSPYKNYTGINIPENDWGSKRLDIGKTKGLEIVVVDNQGNPVRNAKVDVGLYRVEWRWWWDSHSDSEALQFNSANHLGAISTKQLSTNGEGQAIYRAKVDDWGRYMVRVCNEDGHCTGDYFYAGYPWSDDDDDGARQAAAMLNFSSSKKSYDVGEQIELKVPASNSSKCLISIENGTKVLKTFWKDAVAGTNTFSFEATPDMAPNIFVNISLVQPHGQDENDLGLRMYGLIPIMVENPQTKLEPKIIMPDVLEPNGDFTVKVSEAKGEAMTYTIAVVDDGLLDLTRFKTPNPWTNFYAREALGVHTWDLYDYVLGGFTDDFNRILSIGGDDEIGNADTKKKANRFKPVVMHLGPFYLGAGETASHELKMPNYVGSVRTMVVGSGDMAYGSTEKTSPVKKPLMVLATLPRVLGPTESLTLPVNVFAMEDRIKDVNVTVKEVGNLGKFKNGNTSQLHFDRQGDQMANFTLDVADRTGVAKFLVTAKGGGEEASQEIEIQVRNPNPPITNIYDGSVAAGGTWQKEFDLIGTRGSNHTVLEVSGIPPINLGERLRYLIQYPHGCIEQTTSSGFPQLYVDDLLELNQDQKRNIPTNIKATIERLKLFQLTDGSFSYWPGSSSSSDYGTNYAGHFIIAAKEEGYIVPMNMFDRWVSAQTKKAKSWQLDNSASNYSKKSSSLNQAYRLYTLSLAGKPAWGAMNRMKELVQISSTAKWKLAAAYAIAGKPNIAREIIQGLSTSIEPYRELSGTYGSDIRDQAMILETLVALEDKNQATQLVRDISKGLSSDQWLSTQTTAYALLAVAKYVGKNEIGENIQFTYQVDGGSSQNAGSNSPIMQIEIPESGKNGHSVQIRNTGKNMLFARIIQTGTPLVGDKIAKAENLNMSIAYYNEEGAKIDPTRIAQGTDFTAVVSVRNTGSRGRRYEEMALSQVFPSGWEIQNSRMDGMGANDSSPMDYQDIRDDRVYTYFDIANERTNIYKVRLNAAYPGRYYLPTTKCEAMYDNTIQATVPGTWVEVVPSK